MTWKLTLLDLPCLALCGMDRVVRRVRTHVSQTSPIVARTICRRACDYAPSRMLQGCLNYGSIDAKYLYVQRKKSMFQRVASEIRLSLSEGLASASAAAIEVVSTPDPVNVGFRNGHQIRRKCRSRIKEGKRVPSVAQDGALTPDAIWAAVSASLSDVRTLPIDWVQNSSLPAAGFGRIRIFPSTCF
jgi:hypothetical protein